MPISRRFVAQDQDDNQILKMDHDSRYIVNNDPDWQFLFGPNSQLSNSVLILKLTAKFNEQSFDNIQIIGYLYDTFNASVASAGTGMFKIYRVQAPDWTEVLISTVSGTQLANNYFYNNVLLSSLAPTDFDGGESIMIEGSLTRLGVTYRDRVYLNHLGVYDNITRLRADVEFLDISKKDL